MATDEKIVRSAARHALSAALGKNWGWLLTFGIISFPLGNIGLGMTFGLTLATVLLLGAPLMAGGVFQLIHARGPLRGTVRSKDCCRPDSLFEIPWQRSAMLRPRLSRRPDGILEPGPRPARART